MTVLPSLSDMLLATVLPSLLSLDDFTITAHTIANGTRSTNAVHSGDQCTSKGQQKSTTHIPTLTNAMIDVIVKVLAIGMGT